MGEYSKGAITKIELTNFMTYDSVVEVPGPKVNFILGRNGSGKSSIVCAIAICCGSSPSFIGRASTLNDFIKHGKDMAHVRLTLANPGGNPVTIERIIRRGKSANECYFNENRVNLDTYMDEVRKLNIMTDNLVQFLPQERVIDFSGMNAIQLLENTEKTIGHTDLSKMHEDLKTAGSTWKDAAEDINRLRKTLVEAKDKENQLEQDVQAAKHREGLSTELNLAVLKKDRLSLLNDQEEMKEQKEELVQLDKDIHALADKVVPHQKGVIKDRAAYAKITKDLTVAKSRLEQRIAGFRPEALTEIPETLQTDNVADLNKLDAAVAEDKGRLKQITEKKSMIQRINAVTSQVDTSAADAAIAEANTEHQAARLEVTRCNRERSDVQSKKRLAEERLTKKDAELKALQQTEDGLSKYLAEHHHMSLTVRNWLHANRHRLVGNVYGPLIAEVDLKHKIDKYASILESLIPKEQQYMFICEEEDDVDLMMQELVRGQNIRIPIKRVATGSHMNPGLSDVHKMQLKRELKCRGLVSEMFDAPETVFKYLCNRFRMNSIPVFDDSSSDLIARYQQWVRTSGGDAAPMLFAGKTTFKFRKTRFSSSLATSSAETRDSMVLQRLMNVRRGLPDTTPVQTEIARLEREVEELRQREKQAQDCERDASAAFTAATNTLQQAKSTLNDRNKNMERIKKLELEIRKLEVSTFNYDEEQEKMAVKIRERNSTALTKLLLRESQSESKPALLEEITQTAQKYMKTGTDLSRQGRRLRVCNDKMVAKWDVFKKRLRTHRVRIASHKKRLNDHVELFKKLPDVEAPILPERYHAAYQELPAEDPQLVEIIRSRRAQLNAAGGVNLNAAEELKAHQKATQKLQQVIAEKKDEVDRRKNRMSDTKEKWMKAIQELVDKIGGSFAHFYKTMRLTGDVVLDRPENPDHFDKYGFSIKVSYRPNRPLETLSASVHSGGEKSVATALYMLAIQELTKCPFRVVDEINQGMDAENERRVFKMIVETASRCGGQYFILSPKLLPDLHLTSDVTVSVIFAGPFMHSGKSLEMWDLGEICKRSKAMSTNTVRDSQQAATSSSRPEPESRKRRALDESTAVESPSKKRAAPSESRARKLSTLN